MVDNLSKDARTLLAAAKVVLVPQFNNLPPAVMGVSVPVYGNQEDALIKEHLDQYCSTIKSTITAAESISLACAQPIIDSCREGQRSSLESVLAFSGQITVGAVYLQKLDAALKTLRHELCHRFLAQTAAQYLQKNIGERFPVTAVLATLPLSPFNPLSTVREMITRMDSAVASAERSTPQAHIAQLCHLLFDAVESHLRIANTTENFLDRILEHCIGTMFDLADQRIENQQHQQEIEKKRLALGSQASLLKRILVPKKARHATIQGLDHQLAALTEQYAALENASAWLETFVRGLVEQVLSPYLVRTRIIDLICAEHATLNEHLSKEANQSGAQG